MHLATLGSHVGASASACMVPRTHGRAPRSWMSSRPCAHAPMRPGYDMEDAMILNKSAVDRGFAHAYLYKTETIDLREERGR